MAVAAALARELMKEALEEEKRLREEAKAAADPKFFMPKSGVLLSAGIGAVRANECRVSTSRRLPCTHNHTIAPTPIPAHPTPAHAFPLPLTFPSTLPAYAPIGLASPPARVPPISRHMLLATSRSHAVCEWLFPGWSRWQVTAEEKAAAEAEIAAAAYEAKWAGRKPTKGLLGALRRRGGMPPELDQSPRPPSDLISGVEPAAAMKPAPARVKVNPPSKPAWPRPVRYRLMQLPALVEFAVEVRGLSPRVGVSCGTRSAVRLVSFAAAVVRAPRLGGSEHAGHSQSYPSQTRTQTRLHAHKP